jgi:hypothetical protein
MHPHQHSVENAPLAFWRSKTGVVLIMLVAIGAFYLVREHFSHLSPYLTYLPYLILLACPLMHIFGHGHGGHGQHVDPAETNKDEKGK